MSVVVNEAYHGTLARNATKIVTEKRFEIKNNSHKVTNDLGDGVYTYCEDQQNLWNPKKNAEKFAHEYKTSNDPKFRRCSVIKLCLSEGSVIDFDSQENRKVWTKLYENLKYRAEEIWKRYPDSGAKKRHNVDGIIIELGFYSHALEDVDIVLKETYTAFPRGARSNFSNGRECLIRHIGIIEDYEIV